MTPTPESRTSGKILVGLYITVTLPLVKQNIDILGKKLDILRDRDKLWFLESGSVTRQIGAIAQFLYFDELAASPVRPCLENMKNG